MIDKIKNIDPREITDVAALQNLLLTFMNILESQSSLIASQAKEIQELKDEINRMKGEHGSLPPRSTPKVHTGQKPKIQSARKPRTKQSKKAKLEIDQVINCEIDKTILPPDAKLNHYRELIQQDLIFKRNNTLYRVPIYHSKSTGRTYSGKIPESYHGQFGLELQTFVQLFHYGCDTTQGRLAALLKNMRIDISTGKISNILLGNTKQMEQESKEILINGIVHIPYTQADGTKSLEAGQVKTTQVICTEYYTVYQTMNSRCRAHVIGALQARRADDVPLLYDQQAVTDLATSKVPKKDQRLLAQLLDLNQVYTIASLEILLKDKAIALLQKRSHADVLAILAARYYLTQKEFPIVQTLLTDAGHEYATISPHQALCWIHEERHYKKMLPSLTIYKDALEEIRCQIWTYYKKLLNFKELTIRQQNQQRKRLSKEFDQIFTQTTIYEDLNKKLEKTFTRKEKLLCVLDLPVLPLHNNQAELGVRRKVRKRDISLHTMSVQGTAAQDAFMSVVETAIKLGVNIFDYLYDRLSNKYTMPHLADLIVLKA